jgi:hypothetical protein
MALQQVGNLRNDQLPSCLQRAQRFEAADLVSLKRGGAQHTPLF